ncbi:MAG: YeeE/YedE family protein [Bradymonadaceae bacterium]
MTEFTPITATLGGVLIGFAAALMLLFEGRIAGISGILAGVFGRRTDEDTPAAWQAVFVGGMFLGGLTLMLFRPSVVTTALDLSPALVIVAGLLVGFGTRLGNGCTSGHGVCGIPRRSMRSILATLTFMAAAAATVYLTNHVLNIGGLS